ncbi:GspE/PulE family protein [uncultured Deefgea sp.]|uniref:GspE/PulE family protein n=1 Tax=uncultured Deefgea sp. TaxID=1304914 RepID=UPI0025997DFD|nr:type II/IV secretion system protein [uncultured Deefgea sp.]
MPHSTKRRLGEQLIDKGLISDDQLRIALLEQRQSGLLLGKILVDLGFLSDHVLREALSENLGQVSIDLNRVICDARAIALLPKVTAKRLLILPIGLNPAQTKLTVAMANPNHLLQIDQLRLHTQGQFEIEVVLAAESDLIRAIDQYYGFELSIDGILREIETGEIDYSSLNHTQFEYSQPVVRLMDALLADAVRCGASDIHFEPESSFVRIRYRIDGVLRQIRALHKTYWPAMVVRLKVLAQMNIAETRAAQDGRISLTLAGRAIDFRVSAQPTRWGENLVLRILDRQQGLLSLLELGLSAANLALLQQMIRRPAGMILLTGPTGSGKTTTLYSILNHINSVALNIMTLEDPVEYPLPLIRQTSISDASKMDFANGIRSMMRQDPDVILVGEIRDHETAEMAFQAAMTGHLVYSTLHSNSAIGALPRLLDIGVLPDILSGNMLAIIAQRLVRTLCMACREGYSPDDDERRLLQIDTPDMQLYRAVGCAACAQQGYRGRSTVSEILKLDADLDELIARRATLKEIRQLAISKGFTSLADDACRRVREGLSTLDEISRVVDLSERLR